MSIDKSVDYIDCRDAVFQEIFALAKKDPNVMILSADTGAFIFKQFKEELPNQFFYTGITEQNTMSVAAGLAKMGRKPFVFGISNFVTIRCFEQVRIDVCGMNLPVTILGTGTGLIYSADGLTHHITEDVAVMRALPNMTIFSPSDHNSLASIIHTAYRSKGPCYIRFDKGPFVRKYDFDSNESPDHKIFYHMDISDIPPEKKAIYIFANGITTDIALEVRKCLRRSLPPVHIGVVDILQLKPFSGEEIFSSLRDKVSRIVTLEEHNIIGGLGTIVQEYVAENNLNIPVTKLGIPDTFTTEVGSRDHLRKLYGIDADSVLKLIKELQ